MPRDPKPTTAPASGLKSGDFRYGITSLQRGLKILTLLANSDSAMSATEIGRATKLHGSTVHRFLVNLENSGYVSRDQFSNYCLGPRCISLGRAALQQLDVRRASAKELENLNRSTRETVHLSIRSGLTAVYIEKFDSPEPLRIFSHIGASVPLHCTAMGKIFLASLPQKEQSQLLASLDLKRFTKMTLCTRSAMADELAKVKAHGYALDNEEHEPHIKCIAAPIWDSRGEAVAAFSITGPAIRMHKSRIRELIPLVKATSAAISESLGYSSAPAQVSKG
ncbi:MAG: IclR family transcriptional regulator [Acidobacteriaceae bacterium]|nr:IclR family transcriptional regulator [Acidobacteriaceae bacterium]